MKFLFVSTTTVGGSGLSQRQLATRLIERGHEVQLLADPGTRSRTRRLYKRAVNLSTKLRSSRLRPALLVPQRYLGHRVRLDESFSPPVWLSVVPENGYRSVRRRFDPDVIVASSIERVTWRRLRGAARADGVPTVLYLREESAVGHLTITHAPPDLLLANAASLAAGAEAIGHPCEVIPSVIELDAASVESTRRVALLVNPIRSHGFDLVWALADACPDIPFVLQESWPLDDDQRAEIVEGLRGRPNVQVRPRVADPSSVYRDVRVLLTPHRVDNRPRVIAEAQHNGIPVLTTGHPGLVEAVGDGGVALAIDGGGGFDVDEWVAALRTLWDDEAVYADFVDRARAHAARPDNDPTAVVDRFETAVSALFPKGWTRSIRDTGGAR